jgi:hypothetical protein
MCLAVLIVYVVQTMSSDAGADPFEFFQPSIAITAGERARLDEGYPFTRVLQANGLEVAVLAAIPVNIDGDRLVAWERRIEDLKKSPYVLSIGRFSDPPRIEDLAGLELDSSDVKAIQSCRPGDCELKLSGAEMARLQHATAESRHESGGVQQTFRQIVLDRVQQYLANGHIPADEDHHKPMEPSSRFGLLLNHMPFLTDRLPQLAEVLRDFPRNMGPGVESFFYWSKERLARKAMISVTHVTIARNQDSDLPDVLIVGKDVFSTHYINASLSVTALMRGETIQTNYLVYVNRTEVDVLHGIFGGVIRKSIQDHMKNAGTLLSDLRERLESGAPPQASQPSVPEDRPTPE